MTDEFKALMRRADHARRSESDPVKCDWWRGYMRGLRRAHHGDAFGTETEHSLYLAASESDDFRRALGLGYRAGLSLKWVEPGD